MPISSNFLIDKEPFGALNQAKIKNKNQNFRIKNHNT